MSNMDSHVSTEDLARLAVLMTFCEGQEWAFDLSYFSSHCAQRDLVGKKGWRLSISDHKESCGDPRFVFSGDMGPISQAIEEAHDAYLAGMD